MRRRSVWGKLLFVLAGCGLAAVLGAGNADAAQAEAGEEFQFLPGQASFAVA